MPRYRFRWDQLPPRLVDALAAALDLDLERDPPDAALEARFGVRPKPDFVAETWPVLRDVWLAKTPTARRAVVRALRAHHRGPHGIDVSSARGQVEYLHACRMSGTLKVVVLDELLRAGETSTPAPKAPPRSGEWRDFERDLGANLAVLEPGQVLVVSVRSSGRYVQLAVEGDGGVRVESVSDAYLTRRERLSERALARLDELGWHRPTHTPDEDVEDAGDREGSTNHFVDLAPPVAWTDVAALVTTTLREVHDVVRPGALQYASFDHDGNRIVLPTRGIAAEPLAPGLDVDLIAQESPEPRSPAELRAAVEETLRPLLADGGLVTDADDDIVVGWGRARLYVRVLEGAPVVRVMCFALTDVEESPALLDTCNQINLHYPFLKALAADESVVLCVDVPGSPFVGWQLVEAIARLGAAADDVAEELEQQFGVPTLPPGTGGYL